MSLGGIEGTGCSQHDRHAPYLALSFGQPCLPDPCLTADPVVPLDAEPQPACSSPLRAVQAHRFNIVRTTLYSLGFRRACKLDACIQLGHAADCSTDKDTFISILMLPFVRLIQFQP